MKQLFVDATSILEVNAMNGNVLPLFIRYIPRDKLFKEEKILKSIHSITQIIDVALSIENENEDIIPLAKISLQTFIFLILNAQLSFYNTDQYLYKGMSAVDVLHSSYMEKDKNHWETLRSLALMHNCPWPVNPKLLRGSTPYTSLPLF